MYLFSSINSSAINNPQLVQDAAMKFGSQCVVVAIDAKRREDGTGWNIYKNGGRIDVGIDAAAILIPCVPAGLSKIDDAVKLARKADKIGDAVRVADKAGDIAKTEKKVSESAKTIKNARQSAVRKAWRQEQQMVLEKGYGTRNGLKVN